MPDPNPYRSPSHDANEGGRGIPIVVRLLAFGALITAGMMLLLLGLFVLAVIFAHLAR